MGASGLGALLVKEGFLTEQDRVTITKTCGQGSWAFAKCILSTGLLDEDELSAFFAERTKYVVAPKNLLDQLDPSITNQVDRRMVSRLEVLPLEIDHHRITVAVADPLDKSTIKQLEFFTGLEVVSVIAPLSQIYEGLSRLNPEFKPRFTALSNFLKNHAGTAWIKQKIVEDSDEPLHERKSARHAPVEDFDEDSVEEVSLDDDDDSGFESSNNELDDIDDSGLDEGIGKGDFDDIELEDNDDLELTAGDDSDDEAPVKGEIDDSGLELEDPFDNFDDSPKKPAKAASIDDDSLEGLEAGEGSTEDLWPDLDDEPAKPKTVAKAPSKAPAKAALAKTTDPDDIDDFGLDDDKPAAKKAAPSAAASEELEDDFGLDDTPGMAADDELGLNDDEPTPKKLTKPLAADDDDALGDDFGLDDTPAMEAEAEDLAELGLDDDEPTPVKAAKSAANPADDSLDSGLDNDDELALESKPDDELGFDDDEPAPKIAKKAPASTVADELEEADELSFDAAPLKSSAAKETKPEAESTRIARKPYSAPVPPPSEEEDELEGLEFTGDDETSVKLRKAVHEEDDVPQFTDPGLELEDEETRIDLHASVDDDDKNLQFSADDLADEETQINLHPAEPSKNPEKPLAAVAKEPVFAEELADEDALDEAPSPKPSKPSSPAFDGPEIGDLAASSEFEIEDDFNLADALDDGPMIEDQKPLSAPTRSGAAASNNGSIASLTATAKANEALLRMSLCFDKQSALAIAREYLPQISATGCLIELGKTTEAHATWRSGAQAAAQSKQLTTFQRMAKDAKLGQWTELAVSSKDEVFGSVKKISVYKMLKSDGRTLLLAGDYPIEDETLREALSSLAEQLGSK